MRGFLRSSRRVHGKTLCEEFHSFNGNVYSFMGPEFQAIGKLFKCGVIGIVRSDALGNAAEGRFGGRIEESKMQAERIARQREHVAELSSAEDADGHRRFPFCESLKGIATAETE